MRRNLTDCATNSMANPINSLKRRLARAVSADKPLIQDAPSPQNALDIFARGFLEIPRIQSAALRCGDRQRRALPHGRARRTDRKDCQRCRCRLHLDAILRRSENQTPAAAQTELYGARKGRAPRLQAYAAS